MRASVQICQLSAKSLKVLILQCLWTHTSIAIIFVVNIESENTLAIDLWKSRKFTDAVLIVCGEQFHVHRMVLASQLEYFRSMWYGEMQEASETEVKLEGLEDIATPSVFNEVLKFAYTKSLNTHLPLNVRNT